ncbi:MAG TPA: cell division protein [Brevundimonas sp.]|uniref:cell division protein FtsL n=1 Tax=Brevundimonas sp. TaxID=1871086 RepID=UPI00262EF675|nr:cell division protein [Brevundimonas sp.]HRO33392.1 cell division protein [Brevundimonas sp.]
MNALAPVRRLFDWKIRGVRWIEIIGVACVGLMILFVYVAKAGAARESARIGELEREIDQNRQRVRLLRAEAARLEQPGRLEALSRGIGLEPLDSQRQAGETALTELAPDAPATTVEAPVQATAAPVEGEASQ